MPPCAIGAAGFATWFRAMMTESSIARTLTADDIAFARKLFQALEAARQEAVAQDRASPRPRRRRKTRFAFAHIFHSMNFLSFTKFLFVSVFLVFFLPFSSHALVGCFSRRNFLFVVFFFVGRRRRKRRRPRREEEDQEDQEEDQEEEKDDDVARENERMWESARAQEDKVFSPLGAQSVQALRDSTALSLVSPGQNQRPPPPSPECARVQPIPAQRLCTLTRPLFHAPRSTTSLPSTPRRNSGRATRSASVT